jgi:hypothetical protein
MEGSRNDLSSFQSLMTVVLLSCCCCSGVSGNAPTIAVRILERLPQEDT